MVSVGSVVAGKVVKVMNYGAFVDLEGGGSGMIHISEVANTYVKDIGDYLKVGDEVTVKVIGSYPPRSWNRPAPMPSTGDAFEDMLSRYKKSSDDRMSDLKRVIDTRRGSANRRSRSK